MMKGLLVIDANILSHALTDSQIDVYRDLFTQFEDRYTFVVTGLTQYELLCSSDKEHRLKIKRYISDNARYIVLSEVLLDFAAKIRYLYSKEHKGRVNGISICDTVNAAYAIAQPDCHILTIDNTDYPREFFEDVSRHRITYISTKKRETTDTVYVLKPDIDNIKALAHRHDV
ncbi:MAG: hypothetical protein U0520_01525 [Candidatus Saccharimonadales bacterium]|mgnify:CR=1 FL=1